MRLSIAFTLTSSLAALALTKHVAAEETMWYHPQRIAYGDLVNNKAFNNVKASFIDALRGVGMVSITGIPDIKKNEVLSSIHACAMESASTREHTFPDGTRRHTMATHTVPGPGGAQKMKHQASVACDSFSQASEPFRNTVAEATQLFAKRLSSILDPQDDKPLLSTKGGDYAFSTVAEVVENGEHLEHFHSYQTSKHGNEETIDMHTDQGLFLVFTPGLMVNQDSKASYLTGGFYIEQQDGSLVEVQFDEVDDLVFMLGDGVNQYVNSRLNKSGSNEVATSLRATPHALTMPQHTEDEARVWYGRMVLPPSDAVHPDHDKTFGELRQQMIDASLSGKDHKESLSVGCSSNMMARQLEETTCEAGTIYCWHRCMSLEDHGVNAGSCADQGLDLVCTNPRGQVWIDGPHGDFYPGCVDNATAELVTPYPNLPNYPRDDSMCTDEMFDDFVSSADYDNEFDLGKGAVFKWTVENGEVNGRLAFNGIFGYLAMGFANVGGPKNGMHGATIIMALPGDNYSAVDGLDLTLDPTVQEYMIDPDPAKFPFRHWMTPVSSVERDVSSYQVESTDCFTAMTFKTDSIHTKSFNLTGSDELLWSANAVDFYAGHHGPTRGRFAINWVTGEGTLDGEQEPEVPTSGALSALSSSLALSVAIILGLVASNF